MRNRLFGGTLIAAISFSCGDNYTPVFDLAGARVLGLTEPTEEDSNLFVINDNGTVESASDNAVINRFVTVPGGVYVELTDGRRFYVDLSDDSATLIESVDADFVGANSAGDLVFSSVQVFRAATKTVEELSTTLTNPRVGQVSRNFVVISDGSTSQIFDTISTKRYNINACNGPIVVALSSGAALIDDCGNDQLMDIATGTRTDAVTGFCVNNEYHEVSDGALFVSQCCIGATGGFRLCHIDPAGNTTNLLSVDLSPGSSGGGYSSKDNEVLFVSGDNVVVRELSQVSYIKRGVDTQNLIIAGVNVTRIAVGGNKVYYLAEDNLGAPIQGIYDLLTDIDTPMDTTLSFEDLQAVE